MKTETYLYEILIRGLPDGKIGGAHVIYMDRYTSDTGEVLVEKPSQAKAIDVAQIEKILGTEMANALMQLPQMAADKEAAIAEKDAAVAARNAAIETFTKAIVGALDALSALKTA